MLLEITNFYIYFYIFINKLFSFFFCVHYSCPLGDEFLKLEMPTYIEEDGQQPQSHDQLIHDEILDEEDDEEHLDHVRGVTGTATTDQSQGDADDQFGMMDSNELEIMYQQQQQSGEISKYE